MDFPENLGSFAVEDSENVTREPKNDFASTTFSYFIFPCVSQLSLIPISGPRKFFRGTRQAWAWSRTWTMTGDSIGAVQSIKPVREFLASRAPLRVHSKAVLKPYALTYVHAFDKSSRVKSIRRAASQSSRHGARGTRRCWRWAAQRNMEEASLLRTE